MRKCERGPQSLLRWLHRHSRWRRWWDRCSSWRVVGSLRQWCCPLHTLLCLDCSQRCWRYVSQLALFGFLPLGSLNWIFARVASGLSRSRESRWFSLPTGYSVLPGRKQIWLLEGLRLEASRIFHVLAAWFFSVLDRSLESCQCQVLCDTCSQMETPRRHTKPRCTARNWCWQWNSACVPLRLGVFLWRQASPEWSWQRIPWSLCWWLHRLSETGRWVSVCLQRCILHVWWSQLGRHRIG